MRIEYFQIYGKDERNLKWDNLDQIKFNASAQLRSTSTLIQQSGPGPHNSVAPAVAFSKYLFPLLLHLNSVSENVPPGCNCSLNRKNGIQCANKCC